MNEHDSAPTDSTEPAKEAQPATEAPPAAEKAGGISPLRIILLLVLAAMIGALVYDWTVAMPASKEAATKVETLISESAARPAAEGQAGRQEVMELIGHESSDTEDGGHYIIETFKWTRGLPVLPAYYVNVVYNKKKNGQEYTVANVIWNSEVEEQALPGGPVKVPVHTEPMEDGSETPEVDPAQSEGDDSVSPPVDQPEQPATEETPAEDSAPAEESADDPTPTEEPAEDPAPAEEPAEDSAPAEEPAADKAPAEETPEEAPAEEPVPSADEAPAVEEAPAADEAPAESADEEEPATES